MEVKSNHLNSKGGSLCVLMDEAGWPIHIRIIDNAPTAFQKFCRDATIFSLIHSASEAAFYIIGRAVYSDIEQIPKIGKDNFSEKWRELENKTGSISRGLLSFSLHCLGGYIDELIRNMSDEKLREYSSLPVPKNAVPGCLCGCNLDDIHFVQDVVEQNGYSEYFLAQTSKGNWLFDKTAAGRAAIKKFINFLEDNYFDPRLDIDHFTRSVIWLHKSELPKEVNNFNPQMLPDKFLFPNSNINPKDYIGCSERTNHLRPTPESYWANFMTFEASPNNTLATVLSIEKNGTAPRSKLLNLLCSDFSVENEEFCREIRKLLKGTGDENILNKLKSMATRIINDTGIIIRGREHPEILKPEMQDDDSFSPKIRSRRHR